VKWIFLLVACGAPSKPPTAPIPQQAAPSCDSVRGKIEQLYRTEAEAKEPKRVDDAVADNTHMVMVDCAKDPAREVECIERVASVVDLEHRCLAPLDPEGSEGEALGR